MILYKKQNEITTSLFVNIYIQNNKLISNTFYTKVHHR